MRSIATEARSRWGTRTGKRRTASRKGKSSEEEVVNAVNLVNASGSASSPRLTNSKSPELAPTRTKLANEATKSNIGNAHAHGAGHESFTMRHTQKLNLGDLPLQIHPLQLVQNVLSLAHTAIPYVDCVASRQRMLGTESNAPSLVFLCHVRLGSNLEST